ncbi:MAG TPA: serine/threonine-protein kinase [Nitrolancea sp.]|nr:serine/threonine-protein kinase [Nitrolancea sp.]
MTATVEPVADESVEVLKPGECLVPGYVVTEHLHRSRYLDVYDVWSDERACSCVAKLARPDRVDDRESRVGLIREGRLLKRLAHPHIVRIFEQFERPHPVLILETLTGTPLDYIIAEEGRLGTRDIGFMGTQLCSAMHYLHRHGFLHLDLKPANILSADRLVKVIDFSIARRPGRPRKGMGTPAYMAPEQVLGKPLSEATDIWGIGAVLFHAATGQAPFDTGEDEPLRCLQVAGRAPTVRSFRRLPAALVTVIDRCLEPEPVHRPTIDELFRTLKALT